MRSALFIVIGFLSVILFPAEVFAQRFDKSEYAARCENLTPGLPRTVAEIEAFMKR